MTSLQKVGQCMTKLLSPDTAMEGIMEFVKIQHQDIMSKPDIETLVQHVFNDRNVEVTLSYSDCILEPHLDESLGSYISQINISEVKKTEVRESIMSLIRDSLKTTEYARDIQELIRVGVIPPTNVKLFINIPRKLKTGWLRKSYHWTELNSSVTMAY